jgi:hypothetical protein
LATIVFHTCKAAWTQGQEHSVYIYA